MISPHKMFPYISNVFLRYINRTFIEALLPPCDPWLENTLIGGR